MHEGACIGLIDNLPITGVKAGGKHTAPTTYLGTYALSCCIPILSCMDSMAGCDTTCCILLYGYQLFCIQKNQEITDKTSRSVAMPSSYSMCPRTSHFVWIIVMEHISMLQRNTTSYLHECTEYVSSHGWIPLWESFFCPWYLRYIKGTKNVRKKTKIDRQEPFPVHREPAFCNSAFSIALYNGLRYSVLLYLLTYTYFSIT